MKGTIRFDLRLDKLQKSGNAPISLIYSVSGQRKRYSTGISIYPPYWNLQSQKAMFLPKKAAMKELPNVDPHLLLSTSEIEEVNNNLETLRLKIDNIERDYLRKAEPFSSQMIIDLLNQGNSTELKKEDPKGLIYDFISQYIESNTTTMVKGSLSVYKALGVHLKAFEVAKNAKVAFSHIDYKFFQAFQNFLIEHRNLSNTTTAKQLSTLKTFLGRARMHGIIINERYKDFKIKREALEVIALTQTEFERLYHFDLTNNPRLSKVRDVFCFSCATGLRYSDLKQLKREHIKVNEIILTVTKTRERLLIPLNKYSNEILNKYMGHHSPLPVISAANMNLYVKELCQLVGIDEMVEIVRFKGAKREANTYPKYELITNHTGRKTFVTLSLELGMSAEEVMECTGHKDYKSFKRYVKITEERKKVVLVKAWGAPVNELKVIS
jgi:integrase